LIHLRLAHPVFRRRNWFQGRPIHGHGIRDICWLTPEGIEMSEEHWGEALTNSVGVYLNGMGIIARDEQGETNHG
jgi:isoamylase